MAEVMKAKQTLEAEGYVVLKASSYRRAHRMSPTMPISLLVQASPTRVQLAGARDEVDAYREAMCEWCTQHGIDADRVPMTSPIVRDEEQCTVTVEYLQPHLPRSRGLGGHGPAQLVTIQLEAPPRPWPTIVRALYEDPA